MPKQLKGRLVYILIIVVAMALLFNFFGGCSTQKESRNISEVVEAVRQGNVEKIAVSGDKLTITLKDPPGEVESILPRESSLIEFLLYNGVTREQLADVAIQYEVPDPWMGLLIAFGPLLLVGVLILYMMRRQTSGAGGSDQALSFGKSKARMFTGDRPTVTFNDVAGVEEAKEALREVVEFLKEPEKFIALGARIPKGVLMVGPPGCGKTLMARAVAGEAEVPFFSISGSEFVEMFVGVGASRVRDLFEQAKRHSPCIVFVDELDAVGRQRGAGLGGSHDEREQTLNQILVEMDGFDTDTNVIVMAATNRPDILDPALLRPGRFDRKVILNLPDRRGRIATLKIHLRGKPIEFQGKEEEILKTVAQRTFGVSGADLENIVNEAAILAARRGKKAIGEAELLDSIEKAIMGEERRSLKLSPRDKEIAAHHEAGHAAVMHFLGEKVQKVTIVPRGMALGYAWSTPEEDILLNTRKEYLSQLAISMGGRAGEILAFGEEEITSGAGNDIERATELASRMVKRFGMSKELGPVAYGKVEGLIFLGKELGGETRTFSEKTAEEIDAVIKNLLEVALQRAIAVIGQNRDAWKRLASDLLRVETLEAEGIERVLGSGQAGS